MQMLEEIEPVLLWKHFDNLRKIPRCSKHEEKAAKYVIAVAERLNLESHRDAAGNVIIKKTATHGFENAPITVLQSHLDMVCEKNKGIEHDFLKDPIEIEIVDNYLRAKGTSLGADNGMGVCASLAVLEDENAVHGPLEMLFTVDEEEGMSGGYGLDADSIRGRQMINLDTEDAHTIYVGCAGGQNSHLHLPIKRRDQKGVAFSVILKGLKGGHSGADIHLSRGNAIKLLGRLLWECFEKTPFDLVALSGGQKHNAIPREAEATVILPEYMAKPFRTQIKESEKALKFEYKTIDPRLKIEIFSSSPPKKPMSLENSAKVLNLIRALPNGIMRWSPDVENLVETSLTISIIRTDEDEIFLLSALRSSSETQLKALADRIRAVADLASARVTLGNSYPGWQPNLDSNTLNASKKAHKEIFGYDPKIKAIHAGLETGIIGKKFPEMDMISIGPIVKNPHSPDERVNLPSVKDFYDHLLGTLRALAEME